VADPRAGSKAGPVAGPTVGPEAALRAAAAAGEFFRLPVVGPDAGWRPFTELLDGSGALPDRVAAARATLARFAGVGVEEIELRACASVVFLGMAARLTAPVIGALVLGATALDGAVPVPGSDELRWRAMPNGSTEFGRGCGPVTVGRPRFGGGDDVGNRGPGRVEVLARWLSSGPVAQLLGQVRTELRVSPRLLWGDVAAGVGGAFAMLSRNLPADAGSEAARAPVELYRALLTLPPLVGSTRLTPASADDAPCPLPERRRSCCLYYRLPGAGLCADCLLDRAPLRRTADPGPTDG
jgi:hypothetical protein